MREVVHTSRAEQDLLQIWVALSEHGVTVADRMITLISRRCEVLQHFPLGGKACPKFGAEMPWFPAGNYDGRRDLDEAFWRDR